MSLSPHTGKSREQFGVRFGENVVIESFYSNSKSSSIASESPPIMKSSNGGGSFRKPSIYLTLIFASMFIIFDLMLPLYNKSLFAGFGSKGGFHYPVTSSLIQVGGTSLCLLVAVVLNWIIKTKLLDLPHPYFVFSGGLKQFFLKIKELVLVSFLFAGVIVLSNLGLDKASINVNVLLRTTSIIWIIILSFLLRSERPSLLQVLFALLVTAGAVLLSLDVGLGWSVKSSNIPAVVVNLASAMCTGVMFISMRFVVSRQEKYEHLRIGLLEMTMIKMFMATLFILIPALVMETIIPFADLKKTVWQILFTKLDMLGMVLGGVLVTLLFQGSILSLTVYSKALSVGLIQQFMIFPQVALYTIISVTHLVPRNWNIQVLQPTWSHIAGSSLIIVGTLLYGILRIVKVIDQKRRIKKLQNSPSINEEEETISLLNPKSHSNELPKKWYDWIL